MSTVANSDDSPIELNDLPSSPGMRLGYEQPEILEPTDSKSLYNVPSEIEERNRESAVTLPPVDKGRKAWMFVFCGFILEILLWGFPMSFGVFQQYYISSPTSPFRDSSESTINAIGTITVALQYIEIPFVIAFQQRRPRLVRKMAWASLFICVASLLLSSFATAAWHLVALQGVIFGMSAGILYAPVMIWLAEWFVDRRALAGALIFGGSGIGGAVFPLLINFLLTRTGGFRWTLRILAALVGVGGGISLLGVKSRLPIAPVSNPTLGVLPGRWPDLSFFKSPIFISVSLTTMAQALAYFPVSLYIPSYSSAIGLSTLDGTIALAVFNLAGVVGQVIFGHLCDRTAYTRIMIFSSLMSALVAFLLWGFAHNLALLFLFVIIFGSISGGFSSTSPPASKDVVGAGSQSSMVHGCIIMLKGVGVIVGPFVSAALHQQGKSASPSKYGGYGFTGVSLFVGSMMAVTTAGGLLTVFFRARKL